MSISSSSLLAPGSLVRGSGASVFEGQLQPWPFPSLLAVAVHLAHLRHLGNDVLVHRSQFLAGLLGEVQEDDLGHHTHQLAAFGVAQG